MNIKPLHLAIAATVAATLALSACDRQETAPPTTTVEPAPAPTPTPTPSATAQPATATVTAVDIGSEVDANGRVVAGSSTFATTDTITASVMTNTSAADAMATGTLGARWTFEDGQVVNQESKTFNFSGPGTTNFQISKPDGWPVGRYKLEISLDGNVVQTREFEVR